MPVFGPKERDDNSIAGQLGPDQRARVLRAILLACLGGLTLYTLLAPLEVSARGGRLLTTVPVFLIVGGGLLLAQRGALRAASMLLVGGLWLSIAAITVYSGGVSSPAFTAMLVVVLLGGLLFSGNVALGLALVSICFGVLCTLAFSYSLIATPPYNRSDWSWLLAYTAYLTIAAQVISLMLDSVRAALVRARAELGERRAAEAALRASEEKFARAFRATPVGIVITRIADSIVVEVNDAFLQMSGLAREQAVGQHIDTLGLWLDPAERQQARARLQREGSMHNDAITFRRADGSHGMGLISAELVEVGGALCTLGAISDLSAQLQAAEDRRRIEAQMLHAQKLESLGLLAGGIAHDFNNLMSGVMGHSGLALIDLPPESALRPNLLAIEQTARRAADLCQQLLAYAGKSRLSAEPVDLVALVREMLGLIGISIGKQIVLATNLDPTLVPVVAEASQIRQVVLNLVTNAAAAIDAVGGVGTITINARAAAFSREELAALDSTGRLAPGPYVALEVIDDGCGMDAETQQKIFDPFFTTKASGHGLGLAAVQGIALQHGGTIAVRSALGAGTTFTLLLPPAPAAPPAARPAPAQDRAWAARGAVLVVDDEDAVRVLACRILERYGVPALMAADGASVLAIVAAQGDGLAAVLLDLTMPGLSGAETLLRLRQIRPDLPVLLTSGYSAAAALEITAGARIDFIQKPYMPQELIAKLRDLVE